MRRIGLTLIHLIHLIHRVHNVHRVHLLHYGHKARRATAMDSFDTVIIGAGVVGLAIAREIAGHNPLQTIVVLERNARCGQETSSRNSEVIHAGMYYPTGSLKARLCMEGNPLLYAYCRTHGIAHEQTGKLIVARDDAEAATLETILAQGRENRVPGLSLLDAA